MLEHCLGCVLEHSVLAVCLKTVFVVCVSALLRVRVHKDSYMSACGQSVVGVLDHCVSVLCGKDVFVVRVATRCSDFLIAHSVYSSRSVPVTRL